MSVVRAWALREAERLAARGPLGCPGSRHDEQDLLDDPARVPFVHRVAPDECEGVPA